MWTIRINARAFQNSEILHDYLATALNLGPGYGRNVDSFRRALLQETREMTFELKDLKGLKKLLGRQEYKALCAMAREVAAACPHIRFVVDEDTCMYYEFPDERC